MVIFSSFIRNPSFPAADNSTLARACATSCPAPGRKQGEPLGVQVDVLITVSGFTTMPTLSTAVAAKFGMRSDLDAYHLGGHGCAASTLSIFLARQLLLAVRPAA